MLIIFWLNACIAPDKGFAFSQILLDSTEKFITPLRVFCKVRVAVLVSLLNTNALELRVGRSFSKIKSPLVVFSGTTVRVLLSLTYPDLETFTE